MEMQESGNPRKWKSKKVGIQESGNPRKWESKKVGIQEVKSKKWISKKLVLCCTFLNIFRMNSWGTNVDCNETVSEIFESLVKEEDVELRESNECCRMSHYQCVSHKFEYNDIIYSKLL